MPSQSKIILKINHILRNNKTDFFLNRDGVCSGLAALFIKYALEDREEVFFRRLEQVNKLALDYQLGQNGTVDRFLLDIETYFNPGKYSGYQYQQEDLEQFVTINTRTVRNEFNAGFIANATKWEKILTLIQRERRAFYMVSNGHAIAGKYLGKQFVLYDPNYENSPRVLSNTKDLVQELTQCFDINSAEMGLSVRVFANPTQPICTDYPSKEDVHAVLSEAPKEPLYKTISIDNKLFSSLKFAAIAHDSFSIRAMLNHPNFDAQYVGVELLSRNFIEELGQLTVGAQQKTLLLKGVQLNLLRGNVRLLGDIVAEYQKKLYKGRR